MNKPRQQPAPIQSRVPSPQSQPSSETPASTPAKTIDPVFLALYAAAYQGLVMRADLEWEANHLSMRAMMYAEAAYKNLMEEHGR